MDKSIDESTPTTKSALPDQYRNQHFKDTHKNYSTSNKTGLYEMMSDGS